MDEMKVNISRGNSKMGAIPSVSLPAIVTCRKDCSCCRKTIVNGKTITCYAAKLMTLRKTVREAWSRNLEILESNPEKYWSDVDRAVKMNRFFRFHVSGDIPNYEYLEQMVETARENPHCEILVFTKRYEYVNKWIYKNGYPDETNGLPKNLHIVLSAWRDFAPENPYKLPEAHVRFKDGSCTAGENAIECYGNCTECSIAGCGCWKLKRGEQVVFNQH